MKTSPPSNDLGRKMRMMKIRMNVKKEKGKRAPILSSASAKAILVGCVRRDQLPGQLGFAVKKGHRNGEPVSSSAKELVHCITSVPEDLLLFEVLSRVERIKTLHQYKCVSKFWRSVIEGPSFLEAFRSHHRGGLLLSIVKKIGRGCGSSNVKPPVQVNFLYSTFVMEKPEPFFSRKMMSVSNFQGVTNVVNGLACIYEDTRVFVCNVCTGETLRLPDSKFLPRKITGSVCYLGYDATGGVYKLIKINAWDTVCSAAELESQPVDCDCLPYRRLEGEILTLGRDSTWRKVSTVGAPLVRTTIRIFLSAGPLLMNGVMYWIMDHLVNPVRVISFDLSMEKFLVVKPPQNPFTLPRGLCMRFAQLGGRPALYCFHKEVLVFHRLEDEEGNSWSNHTIPLTPEIEYDIFLGISRPFAVGNRPTGQTLFMMIGEGYRPIYSYDYEEKKFERLCVGELSHLIYDKVNKVRHYTITYLEENLEAIHVELNRRG